MNTRDRGMGRRAALQRLGWTCGGVVAGALLPATVLAARNPSGDSNPAVPALKATVLRWLDAPYVTDLSVLSPGWVPASSATLAKTCPFRVTDLVDAAPVRNWSPPSQMQLRLIGYDGVAPVADHGLDVLYPVDGLRAPLPYRLAEVRGQRLLGATQAQNAWAWDGRIPLLVHSGRPGAMLTQQVDLPAERGVYLIALADASRWIDPAALAFGPAEAVFHRRLFDVLGQPMSKLGYFVLSVSLSA